MKLSKHVDKIIEKQDKCTLCNSIISGHTMYCWGKHICYNCQRKITWYHLSEEFAG